MLEQGARVAGYRVERLLGDNSLAGTWLVSAPDGTPAVLRVLLFFARPYQDRFRRSAELLRVAAHPHLVRVLGVVDVEGFAGCVVEHVDGESLGHWIARGPHPPAAIVGVLHGIVSGVSAAHELGLLHRNLKPSMVLLDRAGVPRVDDFALGKVTATEHDEQRLTQMGTTFGTPQYMSPEQFRGAAMVDARADLFSLGCVAYEMCAGRRAFDGKDVTALYGAIARGQYTRLQTLRPDLPAGLVRLVEDLMRVEPADRPQSALEVLDRMVNDTTIAPLLPATRTRRTSVTGVPAEYETPAAISRRPPPSPPQVGRLRPPASSFALPDLPYFLIGMALATAAIVLLAAYLAFTTPTPTWRF